MEWERRAMSHRGFTVELLGVGDYPPTDGPPIVLVSTEDWLALEDPESVLLDPICLAFDVSPDRQVGDRGCGPERAGAVACRGRSTPVPGRAGWRSGWWSCTAKHEVAEIVCDGYGPSAAIARKVDEAGITVRRLDSGEYGKACGVVRGRGRRADVAASRAGGAGRCDPWREGPSAGGPVGVVADEVDGEHFAAGGGDVGACGRRRRTTWARWRSSRWASCDWFNRSWSAAQALERVTIIDPPCRSRAPA